MRAVFPACTNPFGHRIPSNLVHFRMSRAFTPNIKCKNNDYIFSIGILDDMLE